MNALRLSAGPRRRVLAEATRLASAQHRSLHADAPFLFSLPSDPEASRARAAAPKPAQQQQQQQQSQQTSGSSSSQQHPPAPQRSASNPGAPYILSMPPEFEPSSTAGGQLRA